MLGSNVLAVRLGGIYALQRLAKENPLEYHVQIMLLFCSFVRHPTKDEEHLVEVEAVKGLYGRRDDVEATMRAIRQRPHSSIRLEFLTPFHLDFHGGHLGNLYRDAVDLFLGSNSFELTDFSDTKLFGAVFKDINFCSALFIGADLSKAHFLCNSNLDGVSLLYTNLSGTEFSEVIGLTQAQIDQARADPNNPPKLDGVLDAETGLPLVWTGGQGAPLKDDASPPPLKRVPTPHIRPQILPRVPVHQVPTVHRVPHPPHLVLDLKKHFPRLRVDNLLESELVIAYLLRDQAPLRQRSVRPREPRTYIAMWCPS